MKTSIITKQHSDALHEMEKLLFGRKVKIKGEYRLALQFRRGWKVFKHTWRKWKVKQREVLLCVMAGSFVF
jgi:hypothetical protein